MLVFFFTQRRWTMSNIDHDYYHIVSTTDENSSDLDSIGRVPYAQANLVEETRAPVKSMCVYHCIMFFLNNTITFKKYTLELLRLFTDSDGFRNLAVGVLFPFFNLKFRWISFRICRRHHGILLVIRRSHSSAFWYNAPICDVRNDAILLMTPFLSCPHTMTVALPVNFLYLLHCPHTVTVALPVNFFTSYIVLT